MVTRVANSLLRASRTTVSIPHLFLAGRHQTCLQYCTQFLMRSGHEYVRLFSLVERSRQTHAPIKAKQSPRLSCEGGRAAARGTHARRGSSRKRRCAPLPQLAGGVEDSGGGVQDDVEVERGRGVTGVKHSQGGSPEISRHHLRLDSTACTPLARQGSNLANLLLPKPRPSRCSRRTGPR